MRKAKLLFLSELAVATLLVSAVAAAQSPDCASEKSYEFHFWIGEWEVFAEGKLAGTNSIQPLMDGCVLQENWTGVQGSQGTSLNFFNPGTKKWQQFWVWKNGTTLELSGGYSEGKMILEGRSKSRTGEDLLNRITWFNNDDGTVRQNWEVSKDQGQTWNSVFDGVYRKK